MKEQAYSVIEAKQFKRQSIGLVTVKNPIEKPMSLGFAETQSSRLPTVTYVNPDNKFSMASELNSSALKSAREQILDTMGGNNFSKSESPSDFMHRIQTEEDWKELITSINERLLFFEKLFEMMFLKEKEKDKFSNNNFIIVLLLMILKKLIGDEDFDKEKENEKAESQSLLTSKL